MRALQKAVFEALKAAPGVAALVGDRIHDGPPAAERWRAPRVTFGPAQALDADTDCIDARDVVLQLDVWSRDNGRLGPCRDIVDVIDRELHGALLIADPPHAVRGARVNDTRTMLDPDGRTAHGVVTLRARVETVA